MPVYVKITVINGQHCLNGAPIYLRGILDQGYFPEGWYCAKDDSTLRQDVELTKAMGFNFARKHQKAEEPRYRCTGPISSDYWFGQKCHQAASFPAN